VEYRPREENPCPRLSWLEATDGGSKFLLPERVGDAVTLRCCDLPQVGQLLVDKPGRPAAPVLKNLGMPSRYLMCPEVAIFRRIYL